MWLFSVGGIPVEKITDVKRSFSQADRFPPKGVMHTTEGWWDSSLSVFRFQTGTPTFMVGRDGGTRVGFTPNGRLRIAQFMPIGEMALTLKNASGGVETNRDCLVQIELVAWCQWTEWLPDAETVALLRELLVVLEKEAGIPRKRGGDGTRSITRWNNNAGWFGHGETPENDHTDPRALNWSGILGGGVVIIPDKETEVFPNWYKAWKPWYIVQRPQGIPMPDIAGVPSPIPQWAWDDINLTVEINRTTGPPLIFDQWSDWYIFDRQEATRPKGTPEKISEWWWDALNRKLASLAKAKAPLVADLQEKVAQIVVLQNALASARHDLEIAQQTGDTRVAELQAEADRVKALLEQAIAELES